MIRKQIYLTKEQEVFLKSQTAKEAEIIRRALDEYIRKVKK